MGQFVAAVLGSTETVWTDIFAQAGRTYKPPTLVMFSRATQSGCGFAKSAMGPFYCPLDQKVYLDTSFFQDLEGRLGACQVGSKTCQFSQAYVIGHEIGHHVQNLLGVLPKAQQAQRAMDKAEAKPIALLASGPTEVKQSGTSLNPVMWTQLCRPHPPSGMIDCSDSRKATLCPMHSLTALRHNVRGGSRPA